ncbi:MAG: hypothetical protein R2838_07140 [Caldilineaceae bacterium]
MRKTTEAQRRTWDLSQLGLIMWSAEPVQPDTVDRLLRRLCRFRPAPHELLPGLRPGGAHGRHLVERPRFGCATAGQRWPGRTLAVEDGDDVDAALLIGNGPPSAGVTVMIVDPETHKPVQNGQIGEIWVDSESKAPGYAAMMLRLRPLSTLALMVTQAAGATCAPAIWASSMRAKSSSPVGSRTC